MSIICRVYHLNMRRQALDKKNYVALSSVFSIELMSISSINLSFYSLGKKSRCRVLRNRLRGQCLYPIFDSVGENKLSIKQLGVLHHA